jgi:hypothetical protein
MTPALSGAVNSSRVGEIRKEDAAAILILNAHSPTRLDAYKKDRIASSYCARI